MTVACSELTESSLRGRGVGLSHEDVRLFWSTVQPAEWAQAVEWELAYIRYGSSQHYSAWRSFLKQTGAGGLSVNIVSLSGKLCLLPKIAYRKAA